MIFTVNTLFFYLSIFVILGYACNAALSTKTSTKIAQHLASNWFSISTQLQDSTLYSAEWADACHYENGILVTSRKVQRGEMLSLLPIHAVGLKGTKDKKTWIVFDRNKDSESSFMSPNTESQETHSQKKIESKENTSLLSSSLSSSSSTAWTTKKYDLSNFLEVPQTSQHTVPIDVYNSLYCSVNPSRPVQTGWMGHLATPSSSPSNSNCCILAIATPICGLFASKDLPAGTSLMVYTKKDSRTVEYFFKHRHEIEELQKYMDMAYPKHDTKSTQHQQQQRLERPDSADTIEQEHKQLLKYPFYDMPRNYPSLQQLHADPDIFIIPNFLSDAECESLIAKAQPHLVPCVTKNPRTGEVETDSSRTSENANMPQSEFPSIVRKLTQLARCTPEQLEILQVLHYAPGQYFKPHTDGFSGPVTACGFYDSARLVTIFCYLNDVEKGGATRFGELGIDIEPRKGMAVVHFPTTLGFEEDIRTQHEGTAAVDDKWVLATWVWMHRREQRSIYAERWLEPLGEGRIS